MILRVIEEWTDKGTIRFFYFGSHYYQEKPTNCKLVQEKWK